MTRRRAREGPHPVDAHVGRRLRLRRFFSGLTRQRLGERLGLGPRRIERYEAGLDRIGAVRLRALARILDVPVGYFFENPPAFFGTVPTPEPRRDPRLEGRRANSDPTPKPGCHTARETRDLVRAFYRIRCPALRRNLLTLIRRLGE